MENLHAQTIIMHSPAPARAQPSMLTPGARSAATNISILAHLELSYPCTEPRLQGKLLSSLTGFTSSVCTEGWRPIVCHGGCKKADVSVKRSEEGDAVEAHILSAKLRCRSPKASPLVQRSHTEHLSLVDKECREEFPQQHSVMFVVLVYIHLRISRRASELRLFLSGTIQRQSSWNEWMLQEWILKKKPFVCKWNETKGHTWIFPLTECSKSDGRLRGLGFINTMLASSTRPMMNSEQRDVQQTLYLFLLAASSEWQWCLFAAQMSVWRFPHTCISLTHKTHLLTLN